MSTPELVIVATPIGNLQDMSPHAIEVLKTVDFILCEDTRHTGKLLSVFGISTPTTSLHEHNERGKSESLIKRLLQSPQQRAAIVTDAGTPCISDPGSFFVNLAHEAGIRVVSAPGPSALPAVLAASGLQAPRIIFSAFLPRNRKEQLKEFELWKTMGPCLAVFYESPQRVLETLGHLEECFGNAAFVSASREISKIYEEHLRGPCGLLLEKLRAEEPRRGEWAVVVKIPEPVPVEVSLEDVLVAMEARLQAPQAPKAKEICKEFAQRYSFSASELYTALQQRRGA